MTIPYQQKNYKKKNKNKNKKTHLSHTHTDIVINVIVILHETSFLWRYFYFGFHRYVPWFSRTEFLKVAFFSKLNRDQIAAEASPDWWYNVIGHTNDEECDFEGFKLKNVVKDEESDVDLWSENILRQFDFFVLIFSLFCVWHYNQEMVLFLHSSVWRIFSAMF